MRELLQGIMALSLPETRSLLSGRSGLTSPEQSLCICTTVGLRVLGRAMGLELTGYVKLIDFLSHYMNFVLVCRMDICAVNLFILAWLTLAFIVQNRCCRSYIRHCRRWYVGPRTGHGHFVMDYNVKRLHPALQ
jgi:hypothetical protein